MGFVKEQMLHQQERRAGPIDGFVCDRCFEDEAIAVFVRENATAETCTYCGRSASEPIAADADSVVDLIMEGIQTEWVDPVEELAYESAEGGYQGQQIDFDEVLEAVGNPISTYAFQEVLTSATCDYTFAWCKRDYAALHVDEALAHGWSDLVAKVKYVSRFFFLLSEPEHLDPGQRDSALAILEDIARFADSAGLICPLSDGATFWRTRRHGPDRRYEEAGELGTARPEDCLTSNRMSPAGIPAFYGAEDLDTALAEVRACADDGRPCWSAGRFSVTDECLVFDLVDLPSPPSIFDSSQRHLRRPLMFLADFAEQVSKPLIDRGREHIDYVPTQVVSEFLRLAFRSQRGSLQGVRYSSSQRPGGVCVALFVPHERCVSRPIGNGLELVLEDTEHGTL
jgi:hypothetical protein